MTTQKLLILIGLVLVIAGILWPYLGKIPLGRLPGDIVIHKPGFNVYFPVTTMVIVSLAAAPRQDTRARVPFDGTRHQYACLLLPAGALAVVESSLRAGRHSLQGLLATIGWLGVDFAADMRTQDAFANLNTPADIDTLTCTGQP